MWWERERFASEEEVEDERVDSSVSRVQSRCERLDEGAQCC